MMPRQRFGRAADDKDMAIMRPRLNARCCADCDVHPTNVGVGTMTDDAARPRFMRRPEPSERL